MSKVKESVRMALIVAAALLLAVLGGILVTHADGPVIWKEQCPAHYEVRFQTAVSDPGGGVHVLCVRMAEEVKR